MDRWDLIVVGAGTAGAACARAAARHGLRTLLLDRSSLDAAGARWVNDVLVGQLVEAGVPVPEGEARVGPHGGEFHMLAGWGPTRAVTRVPELLGVDMRRLVRSLHDDARAAGAELRGDVRVDGVEAEPGGAAVLAGGRRERAEVVVDASGLAGVGALDLPAVDRADVCAAAQAVFEVRDRAACEAYFERNGARLGDVLCYSAVAGGYSIVRLASDGEQVLVLTGSIPALGHPSGKRLLDDFVASQPWVGPRRFGGHRALPVRRPRDLIARGRVALLGDAACQIFPAHGSGIGTGLIAARALADTLAAGGTPERWARAWMRRQGALLAVYDLFRRFATSVTAHQFERLLAHGAMDATTVAAGIRQTLPPLGPGSAANLAGLARCGWTGARFASVVARVPAVLALYRLYPGSADPPALACWSAAARRLMPGVAHGSR